MATENDSNFTTALDLRNTVQPETGKLVQHFVYGSSLYGTTFGVYCGVEGKEVEGDPNSYEIANLHLKIINYAGVLNIGFLGGSDEPSTDNSFQSDTIRFSVQGGSIIRELTIKGPRVISEPVTVTFQRTLHPLNAFKAINNAPTRDTQKNLGETPNDALFDTEFNYRNGVDFFFRTLRPGMHNFREPGEPLPSPRCHKGFVRFGYKC